jgi:hypothetical protein
LELLPEHVNSPVHYYYLHPLFPSCSHLLDSFNSLLLLCTRRRWNWPSA